jgi:hypothetical protein
MLKFCTNVGAKQRFVDPCHIGLWTCCDRILKFFSESIIWEKLKQFGKMIMKLMAMKLP